jgi:hypothetical protein
LAQEAKLLSRAQNWEELPKLISDDILEQFVVFGTYDVIGRKLLDRYGDVVTNCEFSIAVRSDGEKQIMQQLVCDLHAAGEARARQHPWNSARDGLTRTRGNQKSGYDPAPSSSASRLSPSAGASEVRLYPTPRDSQN